VTSAPGEFMTEPTKTCPSCGGVILAVAKKCKHCKSYIDQAGPPATAALAGTSPAPLATSLSLATAQCAEREHPGRSQVPQLWRDAQKTVLHDGRCHRGRRSGGALHLPCAGIRCQQDQAVEDATGAALAATRARDREERPVSSGAGRSWSACSRPA